MGLLKHPLVTFCLGRESTCCSSSTSGWKMWRGKGPRSIFLSRKLFVPCVMPLPAGPGQGSQGEGRRRFLITGFLHFTVGCAGVFQRGADVYAWEQGRGHPGGAAFAFACRAERKPWSDPHVQWWEKRLLVEFPADIFFWLLLYIFACLLIPTKNIPMAEKTPCDTRKHTAKVKAKVLWWNERHLNKCR